MFFLCFFCFFINCPPRAKALEAKKGLILALDPAIQSSQNILDGGQVGAIPQRVSCAPLRNVTWPGFTLLVHGSVHQSGPHYKYPLLRSRTILHSSSMDPSFQTVNPFATFYPPQGTEYDAYAAVDRTATISSQITLTCYLDPPPRIL